MKKMSHAIANLIYKISALLGLGSLKAVMIGIFGAVYAYISDDGNLFILTISFTVLAYIVYAMEWGLKK